MARSTETFRLSHLAEVRPQPRQKRAHQHMLWGMDHGQLKRGYTFRRDGRIVYIGGILATPDAKTAALWSIISDTADRTDMIRLVRRVGNWVRHLITRGGYRRVQTVVYAKHTEGHRMARLLGFTEDRLVDYAGDTYTLYTRT